MGEKFAWFFDVAIIGIIFVCIFLGSKRGFAKTIVLLAGYILALVGSFIISSAVSPTIYDKFVKTKAESIVVDNYDKINIKTQIKQAIKDQNVGVDIPDSEIDRIINAGGDYTQSFAQYAKEKGSQIDKDALQKKFDTAISNNTVLTSLKDKIPDSLYKEIENYLGKSKDTMTDVVKALNNPSKEEGAKQLTEVSVKPMALMIIKIIVFIIVFAILMIIVRFASGLISGTVKAVPLVGSANSFLGGVLGLIQGAVLVLVITFAIKLLVTLTSNDLLLFNTPTIEETHIFKLIYNLKLFK